MEAGLVLPKIKKVIPWGFFFSLTAALSNMQIERASIFSQEQFTLQDFISVFREM